MGLQDDPAQPDHQDDLGNGEEFDLRTLEQERGQERTDEQQRTGVYRRQAGCFFLTTIVLPERTVAGLRVPYLLIYNPV